jgi:CRP/FNR family transcriptional regulator, cyclic AMP receptor protein
MHTSTPATGRIFQFLSAHPLFEGIGSSQLKDLASASHLDRVERGNFVFFQSDPANSVYMVWSGVIALRLENPDGRELVINEMSPGDCFGELGVLTSQPRSTSAEAIVDSVVLVIPSNVFMQVLNDEPTLSRRLLEMTARRLQNSSKREEALAFYDAQQRLAGQLLHLDQLASDKGYLTISQDELATRVGLTRQTVATILGRWRRMGWLLTGRGHIVLLNRVDLSLLSQEHKDVSEY